MNFHTICTIIFTLLLQAATSASADEVPAGEYAFPVKNPLVATLLSQVLKPDAPYETLILTPKPERSQTPVIGDKNFIRVGLFAQKDKKAPLAFLISGTGGLALDGDLLFLASQIYRLGYHVVTLPNPLSWQYALSLSATGLPGYTPRDAHEYYSFLSDVVAELKSQKNLDISGYAVGGYSHGGLVTAFLMKEDSTQHKFNFQKGLIINPAIDLGFGIDVLDSYYDQSTQIGKDRCKRDMSSIIALGERLLANGLDLNLVESALKEGHFEAADLKYLIGESFRESLGDLIFTSQQVTDSAVLKTPASNNRWNAREAEARNFNFRQYIDQFVYPTLKMAGKQQVSEEAVLEQAGMYALRDFINADKRLFVLENRDDFIINSKDIAFLKENFGDRLYLYPNGGHVGNLWFERNVKDISRIMALPQ